MRLFLALLVLLAPIADLYLLVVIAHHIGGWPVFGFALASALLGGRLARREGRRVLRDFEAARREGQAPREGLASAALLAASGALLILPGLASTLAGLALLVPAVRRLVGRAAQGWVERRLAGALQVDRGPGAAPGAPSGDARGRVIDIDEHGRPIP